jgi:hypothetical protein
MRPFFSYTLVRGPFIVEGTTFYRKVLSPFNAIYQFNYR